MNTKELNQAALYPLRFEPIYQYRVWGGRQLADYLSQPLPDDGPIGEAWLLSDRDDHPSRVANGPLQGQSIGQLFEEYPEQLMGKAAGRFQRFPLLLKYLDAQEKLSVQVHPSDQQTNYLPPGESGKTEAWFVLAAGSKSRIYAGLQPNTTAEKLQSALQDGTIAEHLTSFTPQPGDGVFLPAGTVHALGDDIVVFEVQENSDVTFRLYDWDRVDPKTEKLRPLQLDQAMACIDYTQVAIVPVVPVVEAMPSMGRERFFDCDYFGLWRLRGESPFTVGVVGRPRILVCIAGDGQLTYDDVDYAFSKGDVWLLPAVVGACLCQPQGAVTLLEISLPDEQR